MAGTGSDKSAEPRVARRVSHRGIDALRDAEVPEFSDKDDTGAARVLDAEIRIDKWVHAQMGSEDDLENHHFDALVSYYCHVRYGPRGKQDRAAAASSRLRELIDSVRTGKNVPEQMRAQPKVRGMDLVRLEHEIGVWNNGRPELLSPKVRMIANGDAEVNGYRALLASSVSSSVATTTEELLRAAADEAPGQSEDTTSPDTTPSKDTTPEADRPGLVPATSASVSCFVHLEPEPGHSGTAHDTIEVHDLSIGDLFKIRNGHDVDGISRQIAYVEAGSPVAPPKPYIGLTEAVSTNGETPPKEPPVLPLTTPPQVIVGLIDVGGFDFAHPDFMVRGFGGQTTRFLALWDQGMELDDCRRHLPGCIEEACNDAEECSVTGKSEDEPHAHHDSLCHKELLLPSLKPVDDLQELHGVGPKTAQRLKKKRVRSIADVLLLCATDQESLESKEWRLPAPLQTLDGQIEDRTKSVPVPFGTVYGHADLDQALRDARQTGLDPTDFVDQTIEEVGSHGTHVASIAAGNSGVCPDAWIVGVNIAMGEEDSDRRSTFYDSTRLAEAIDFITSVAETAGLPVVINISLGTNGHAHDGTSPINKLIESKLRQQGRVVCVAAGNSGKETAAYDGDLGFMSGRIHSSGVIKAKGLTVEVGWQVIGNGIIDVSENEMEIWYNPGDEFAVELQSPSGQTTPWVVPGGFLENFPMRHSPEKKNANRTFVSVYSERFVRANGANRISVFLSPKYKGAINGVAPGVWKVRLRGEQVRNGSFNAWIERDDLRQVGRLGDKEAWSCPSFFTLESNTDTNSLSSLGCSPTVIAVANVKGKGGKINATSSQGPTRDGRPKPDIAAPGTDILAARGFARQPANEWIRMTGTSMASPFVAGVAANMLAAQPTLTAGQVLGVMQSTAQPLAGADFAWRDDTGFGVIDEDACFRELDRVFLQVEKKDRGKT